MPIPDMPRIPVPDVRRPGMGNGGGNQGQNPDPRDPRNQQRGLLSPFFPGDKQAIADQLAAGYGGDPEQIRGLLAQIYSPMRMGFRPGQGGGFGGGGNGVQPPPTFPPNGLTVQPGGPVHPWKTSPPGR